MPHLHDRPTAKKLDAMDVQWVAVLIPVFFLGLLGSLPMQFLMNKINDVFGASSVISHAVLHVLISVYMEDVFLTLAILSLIAEVGLLLFYFSRFNVKPPD